MNGISAIKEKQGLTDSKIEALKMEFNGRADKIEAKVIALEG